MIAQLTALAALTTFTRAREPDSSIQTVEVIFAA
jgi:hypothetical protein